MERDFSWDKPFARKRDIAEGTPLKCQLIAVCDPPLVCGDTHIVRVGDVISCYSANGQFYAGMTGDRDLVNIPEKKVVERWVVIPSSGMGAVFDASYWAEQMATDYRSTGVECRIHHIKEEF